MPPVGRVVVVIILGIVVEEDIAASGCRWFMYSCLFCCFAVTTAAKAPLRFSCARFLDPTVQNVWWMMIIVGFLT